MINSDLIKTLVIDRPNLRMNNREKIIGGDSLWRPTEAAKKNRFFKVFDVILSKSGLWIEVAYDNWKLLSLASIFTENLFKKTTL